MPSDRRARLLEAALEALRTKGFAGASTRAIAALAGVNPGLIFYYFGTLDELLLEALRESSEARLQRYRAAAREARSFPGLVALLRRIYQEDLESGHIRVVCEMVSAGVARPEIGRRVMELMEPWIGLAEEAVQDALADAQLPVPVPARELAFAAVTFYLGANLVVHLGTDPPAVDGLLGAAEQGAAWLELLGGRAGDRPGS